MRAPSGQISAQPRLQHDWQGNTRSHCEQRSSLSGSGEVTEDAHLELESGETMIIHAIRNLENVANLPSTLPARKRSLSCLLSDPFSPTVCLSVKSGRTGHWNSVRAKAVVDVFEGPVPLWWSNVAVYKFLSSAIRHGGDGSQDGGGSGERRGERGKQLGQDHNSGIIALIEYPNRQRFSAGCYREAITE